ncbi:DNA-binding transcriptional ArsR family regulator [Catenulispora sp. GP43]|uniref:methyltransferase n=1 Tax=Catenulispora sp. GP43 TaxID=3156263 RepID=UPI003514EB12
MTELSDVVAFRDLLASRWIGPAIHAAAVLGLADVMAGQPMEVAEVAEAVGAEPDTLRRLLRALTTIGLVEQDGERFRVTSMGALLSADSPVRLRDQVLLTGGEGSLRGWGQFAACVRTGDTAAKILDGVDDPFASFDGEARARFDAAMAEGTRQIAGAVERAYDFEGITSLVDVGGGYGTLLLPILHASAERTGVVFDRPGSAEGAQRIIEQEKLTDRYRFAGGDFFTDPVPEGADAYLLKSVIHDWDDARALAILRACRLAMRADSRLLLIEVVVPDRLDQAAEHRRMVWADLNMMVATGGQERSRSQYEALLTDAGLRIERIVPIDTPTMMSVIETRPL